LPSFADVLGKLESPRAAAALLQAVKDEPPGRGKAVEDAEAYSRAVVEALKRTRSDEVKGWIAGEGFKRAGPGRLQVLLRLVAALKLEAARGAVIESLGHPSAEVAQAAVEAIERIGLGDDAGKLEELLSKGKKPSLALRIQILDALAVSGSESGMAVVMKAARDTDPETRAIALGSLGRRLAAPGAVEALIAGLEDPAHEVRNAALRALNRARARPMIGALIRFIEKEKDEKLRLDALQLLIRASGKNMGLLTDDWRKWWSVAEASFEFPKDDGKAITSVKSYDLEYFGIEVSSKRIAFLVDASSSMLETVPVKSRPEDSDDEAGAAPGRTKGAGKGDGGNAGAEKRGRARKIDILKKELSRVIQKLPADTHINIVYFHSNYSSWKKELHPLAGPGRKQAVDFVQGLQNGQGTNVFDTLEFALKDKRVDTIFLLTDGLPTRGRLTEPAAIRREIGIQNRVRGATINCIAFGEESPLLKDLAAENGGVYRFVDSY
jgi:HEAT repeat protein